MSTDHVSVRRDFGSLLSPASIAVFGASPDDKRFGGRPLRNLLLHKYPGRLIPINPKYTEIGGLVCYPSLEASGQRADLALVAVPRDTVLPVLGQCARAGVGLAIVFSSGFAESDVEGRRAQEAVTALARSSGMRVMGPNCLGFLNAPNRVTAVATGALEQPDLPAGSISLVAQSGAMGFVGVFNRAYDAGVAYRYAAATGNEADVTVMDFLEHFLDDGQTKVATALLESIREPDRFLAFAARSAETGKPVVVLKTGRSEEAVRAAVAHTASLAGEDAVHDAVFRRFGIIRVDEIDELWQVPQLLTWTGQPVGRRVAVISTSGGFNGILADHLRANGLELPALSEDTVAALRRRLPSFAYLGNPLDLTGQFAGAPDEGPVFAETLSLLDADPNVDVIALVQVVVRRDFSGVALQLVAALSALRKPSLVVAPGGAITDEGLRAMWRTGIPVFRSASACSRALRHACDYADFRRSGPPRRVALPRVSARGAGVPLSYRDTTALLNEAGIEMVDQAFVATPGEARDFLRHQGGRIVLKAVGPGLPHKCDMGAIRLNLSERDIDDAFAGLLALGQALGSGFEGIIAQPMVEGLEVIVGLKRDHQFGPILALGAGGVLAELVKDVVLEPLPVDRPELEKMLGRLQLGALVRGYRGSQARDLDALADLVARVSSLGQSTEGLEALDLNPVILLPEGHGLAIVDALAIGRRSMMG